MRLEELILRIPGDEFQVRFHEQLTVLSGIGMLERQALALDNAAGPEPRPPTRGTLREHEHGARPVTRGHASQGSRTKECRVEAESTRAALDHIDDADVVDSLAFMIEHTRGELKKLEHAAAVKSRD